MSTITLTAPQARRLPAARSQASPALRLTRRGKIVVLTLAFVAIALLALVLGPSVVATGDAGAPEQTTSVTLMAGQTLWQVAADANPHGDIRDTVDDIVRLNSLSSASAVQPGSTIAVPVYER